MANILSSRNSDFGVVEIVAVFDSNGNLDFTAPRASTINITTQHSNGTIAVQAAADGENYAALPTAISITGAGNSSVAPEDVGFHFYRLAGSGAPVATLTILVSRTFQIGSE